jgi:RNA polymerase sigma factor (sigma-70 family)
MDPDASETALVRLTDGLDERWEKALQCLELREKEVVWLHAVEEWPHAAIAEQLGTSEGNVKVIYHRAMGKLRRYLGGEEGGMCDGAT